MKKIFFAALACFALIVPQNQLEAQISWSTSTDLFAGGDNSDFISQNGTFVLGINPGGFDTTIGTAVFTNLGDNFDAEGNLINLSGLNETGGVASTQNGVTFTGNFDSVQSPTFGAGEFTDAAAGINELINTATFGHTYDPANPDTVTFSGLTPGDTYEIQVLVSDARGGTGGGIRDERWFVAFTNGLDDLVATTAQLSNRPFNDGGSPGMAGDFVIGTFVAGDDATISFSLSATRGNSFGADPVSEADQFIIGESIDITANDPPGTPSSGQTQINALQLRNISDVEDVLLGDANCDGEVDFLDIAPFIALLSSNGDDFKAEADLNRDGEITFADIAPFIAALQSSS